MALVMWEVLRRTRIGNRDSQETPEYQHPYYDHVDTDPNIEDMKNIVVKYRHRPEFDDEICKFLLSNKLITLKSGEIRLTSPSSTKWTVLSQS